MFESLLRLERLERQIDRLLGPDEPAKSAPPSTEWVAPKSCEEFFRRDLKLDITDAQWVLIRVVFDRVDPIDLATDEQRAIARTMFGPVERISSAARHTVAMLKGARVGGTWFWSLFLLYRALTADLSRLAPGEKAYAPIVAERMDLGVQSINYIKGALTVAGLDHLRENDATESVEIRRHDGHRVIVKVFAAARGGAAVRGKSFIGALLDEACFFRAKDSGIVNDQEIYRAIAPRVMAGGTLGLVSTAWGEEGILWDLVLKNLGRPGEELHASHETALACITPTELLRNDDKIKADIAISRATDPESAAREFDCIPLSTNTSRFFGEPELRAAIVKDLPLEILPDRGQSVGIGLDTGLVRDSSSVVAVHLDDDGFYTVAAAEERRPTPKHPLKLSEVCAAYLEVMKRQNAWEAVADQHEFEASKEYLESIELIPAPGGHGGKQDSYTLVRNLLRERRIRIPECHEKLLKQLREVTCKPLDGGNLKIWSPRNKGGHGDIVSSLVNAIWYLHENDGSMLSALRASAERRKTA
jgi:hypothetical protein